ncbi:MAG: V-type ATP synthase subunit D [Oscillospiraceae bacterium]|jgi:V/A-type H+-transporting ATPase subunit D|nr:V-type ATP synthase subunit D [Oscillospiraceae bacterium]
MASTAIIPTRMVLNQLKGRLKTARRGHKLLKDKRDELMRQFMDIIRKNMELRVRVEEGLTAAFSAQQVASSIMSPEMLEQALLYPRQSVDLKISYRNIMSVNVPEYTFKTKSNDPSEIYPYGFAQTSGELDDALEQLAKVFNDMLELAQIEKSMQLLAQEIEKTRRRVNALEYSTIPTLEENIKYITMKLEENENSTKVRLLKVKDMVLQKAHNYVQ